MAVLERAADMLRVLAHPHRLKLVELLLKKRHTVNELAETTSLPASAVSQHLTQMRHRGVLDVERVGREAFYHVINPNARNLIDCIRKHGSGRP